MSTSPPTAKPSHAPTDFPIAIIGAGFAGIGTAIQLKQAGIHSFTIFERADEVGGTWRDNTYPGAACDVPSHVYSLLLRAEPGLEPRASPSRGRSRPTCSGLVEKWGLRAHLRLDTEIVEARFDEAAGRWTLTTGADESFEARVVVSGVGGLVDPRCPTSRASRASRASSSTPRAGTTTTTSRASASP